MKKVIHVNCKCCPAFRKLCKTNLSQATQTDIKYLLYSFLKFYNERTKNKMFAYKIYHILQKIHKRCDIKWFYVYIYYFFSHFHYYSKKKMKNFPSKYLNVYMNSSKDIHIKKFCVSFWWNHIFWSSMLVSLSFTCYVVWKTHVYIVACSFFYGDDDEDDNGIS